MSNVEIKLSAPYAGTDAGFVLLCDKQRAKWLIENGYSADHQKDDVVTENDDSDNPPKKKKKKKKKEGDE